MNASDPIPVVAIEGEDLDPCEAQFYSLYQSKKVYTRRVSGVFQRLKRYCAMPLLFAYVVIPWLSIDGKPVMLFDVSAQKFHLFGLMFWPQESYLLTLLLIIAAFSLFTATVVVGRVWCGFICPQTVWTMMFIWVEELCEGGRNHRIKLDEQSFSAGKCLRKLAKHSLWLCISLITGFTFVSYFYGGVALLQSVVQLTAEPLAWLWIVFFTLATYLNAGWLRDQVCKHMCPYARFQSVLYDQDTLLVSYDARRGEPRRDFARSQQSASQGDCVDCSWCVQVCPVDIDIRDGMQYACIDCGLCIDACDTVMQKLAKPLGLIRFSTLRQMAGGQRALWRPRFVAYLLATVFVSSLLVASIAMREPLQMEVIRDRGDQLYIERGDRVENIYTLKLYHQGYGNQTVTVSVDGDLPFHLSAPNTATIFEGEVLIIPVRVSAPVSSLNEINSEFIFKVTSQEKPALSTTQAARFIGPFL